MSAENRFLQGSFAPVAKEITAFDLPVTGRVPAGLSGRYLRNGPNPLGLDDPDYHWFLGAGMVHGVRLRDGRAEWYRNRWVRSKAVAEALGEKWPAGPVHAGMDFAANTHIIAHAGRTLATVEAGPLPYELSDELDTRGPCDFGGTLPGGFAAHTKLDPRTGELHAIAYFWAWDHVQHVVVDAGRPGEPHHGHCGRRRADDARLRPHREVCRLFRPAGHVQHGRGISREGTALHVEPGASGPRRPAAPRRRPGGRPLAGDQPLLGLPHAQRLRRRRAGRGRSVPVPATLRRRHALGRARARRHSTGGSSTLPSAR